MKEMIDPTVTATYQYLINAQKAAPQEIMPSMELFDDMREFITDTIKENPGSKVVNILAPELLDEFNTSPNLDKVRATITPDIAFRLRENEVFEYYEHNAFSESDFDESKNELIGFETVVAYMDAAAQQLASFNERVGEIVAQETGREVINFIGMSKSGQFFALVK